MTCPLAHHFFGLTPEDRKVILEQHYFLIRRLGMSYTEVRDLPVMYRQWFIDRFIREIEEQSAAAKRTANEVSSTSNTMAKMAGSMRKF